MVLEVDPSLVIKTDLAKKNLLTKQHVDQSNLPIYNSVIIRLREHNTDLGSTIDVCFGVRLCMVSTKSNELHEHVSYNYVHWPLWYTDCYSCRPQRHSYWTVLRTHSRDWLWGPGGNPMMPQSRSSHVPRSKAKSEGLW